MMPSSQPPRQPMRLSEIHTRRALLLAVTKSTYHGVMRGRTRRVEAGLEPEGTSPPSSLSLCTNRILCLPSFPPCACPPPPPHLTRSCGAMVSGLIPPLRFFRAQVDQYSYILIAACVVFAQLIVLAMWLRHALRSVAEERDNIHCIERR
ncbi:hypothetical protein B0H13DRAFT_248150 [Mycena leptocephala]|nr:hypothetical protein B0H13DRAFT_248150 [Mycena leptocephala]